MKKKIGDSIIDASQIEYVYVAEGFLGIFPMFRPTVDVNVVFRRVERKQLLGPEDSKYISIIVKQFTGKNKREDAGALISEIEECINCSGGNDAND